ncbi:hypothetical protein H1R20_g11887, partial [Candolleomyces eurysporus]
MPQHLVTNTWERKISLDIVPSAVVLKPVQEAKDVLPSNDTREDKHRVPGFSMNRSEGGSSAPENREEKNSAALSNDDGDDDPPSPVMDAVFMTYTPSGHKPSSYSRGNPNVVINTDELGPDHHYVDKEDIEGKCSHPTHCA